MKNSKAADLKTIFLLSFITANPTQNYSKSKSMDFRSAQVCAINHAREFHVCCKMENK